MELNWYSYVLVALAAVGAGLVNALAGGGTLITFPTLIALGLPSVAANMTNTVALVPGYLGGILGQRKDLVGQKSRLFLFIPAGLVGGFIGGVLLQISGDKLFSQLVPYLILLASGLLAVQEPVKAWLTRRAQAAKTNSAPEKAVENPQGGLTDPPAALPGANTSAAPSLAAIPAGLAAIYGGYFGAGLSVIILAVLGLIVDDSLTRLNALKQAISFSANIAAAVFFIFSGLVHWPVALVMAVGALLGGALGGRLAGRIKPATLRWMVVSIGLVVGLIYLFR